MPDGRSTVNALDRTGAPDRTGPPSPLQAWLRRLEAAHLAVLTGLAWLAGAIFLAMAVLIPVDVVLRNTGQRTLYFLLDGIEYGLLLAIFLAAPWVLAKSAHVRVDIFASALPPPLRRQTARLVNLLGATLSALFGWFALEATLISAARGSLVIKSVIFPEWWALAIVPVSCLLLALEFLRRLVRDETDGGHQGL